MSDDIATKCIDDLTTQVAAVGEFGAVGKEKVFSVYSEDDLLDKTKLVRYPAVGVMYEGLRPTNPDASRQGMGGDVGIALVLLLDPSTIGGISTRNEATRLLGLMRAQMRMRASPSGHKWRFMGENPAGMVGNAMVYVQRWATATPLTN
jgi:hypothetical protein